MLQHPAVPRERVVTGVGRLQVSHDALDLRALLSVVESSVAWWQRRLDTGSQVTREQAAAAISDLSRILESLSQQLAQGRETVRITTRLPRVRAYALGCPACGRGNRAGARYCQSCGTLLPDPATSRPAHQAAPTVRVQTAACSDTGQERTQNEDTCYAGMLPLPGAAPAALLLVADGMGGMQAGDEASRLASETARRWLAEHLAAQCPTHDAGWHDLLRDTVREANRRVYEQATHRGHQGEMGTTLTLLLVVGQHAHLAHVGDSRAYLLNRDGVTEDGATWMQMTSDHSLVARLVDIGQLTPAEAQAHPQRNILYRALGTHPAIEVDTLSQPLQRGDRLLLCSDGLIVHLADAGLARLTLEPRSADAICNRLIAAANERGGTDNISVVLALVEGIEHAHL
jgi:protein phosphatase